MQLLDLSKTTVSDLASLADMNKLQLLNLDHTAVRDLNALNKLNSLNILQVSHTDVSSLKPLEKLDKLTKIYCDHSNISQEQARQFMLKHPQVLVIYETAALKSWWEDLPIYWKAILAKEAGISDKPGTEELHRIINIKTLNLSRNAYLQKLDPVARLSMLETLWLSGTEITDLKPLENLSFF